MKISSIMTSDLEVLIAELEAKKTDEKAKLEALEARILKLEQDQAERDARILKLEQGLVEREAKKNCKFQTRCIQIAKEILNEEPMIEYRPPFLNWMPSSKNIELHWRCKGHSIGFIALAGIRMLKNSKTLLIVIGKNDAYVKIMEFPFLKYGTMKNRKPLSLKGYKKLRSLFI